MLSFVLLGALFTLGQCGGVDSDNGMFGEDANIPGVNGVDPTPKPTEPPFYKNRGCADFEDNVCDVSTTIMTYTGTGASANSESTCVEFCKEKAGEHGAGCCQFGGCVDVWNGRQCGAHMCQFFHGSTPTDNPETDYPTSYRGKTFKRSYCSVGQEAEATSFFAQTSDGSALILVRNFCAAVGLVTSLFGAFKYYFGSKN